VVLIILGGYRSLSGCVAGGVLITFAEEIFKHIEETLLAFAGTPLVLGYKMPQVFGLTALSFSALILLVLYLRPEGIVGYREVAAMAWFRRLFPAKTPPAGKPALYRVDDTAKLEVVNLAKHYGPFKAMTNVNIAVSPGEIVGLIGPNGAGKTTLINTITGTLFATAGKIMLNGEDATRWSAAAMAQAGLGRTFQNIRLFTSLTVLENVVTAVSARQKSLNRAEAEGEAMAWLKTLALDQHAQDLAGGLAYGDQRRLEIARALALHPDFLLADEPAAGMNHTETQALKDLLRDLARRYNIGVLLIEHDLPMVMELSTRIAVLTKGEQIAMGAPSEIRKNPAVIEAYIGEEQDA
jgi:branched-chain amino acid transport system permease protein